VVEVLVDGEDDLDDAIKDERLRGAVAAARAPPRKLGARPAA
jgi:hypothetical protein